MYVSNGTVSGILAARWGPNVVESIRYEVSTDIDEQFLVDVPGREIALQPALRILIMRIVCQLLALSVLIILVISGPYHNTRMVSQPLHISNGLVSAEIQKVLVGGIVATSKEEVLPDEYSVLIAGFVKGLVLKNATSPHTKHGLMTLHCQLNPALIEPAVYVGKAAVGRNPVASATKDGNIVDLKVKGRSWFLVKLLLNHSSSSQSNSFADFVDSDSIGE